MAHAQTLVWNLSDAPYDIGYNPSVAMSGLTAVEVHNGQAGFGPMWYHVGAYNGDTGALTWGPPYNYDNGYNPSVATSGSIVVEVHNGQAGYGPMWYHVGYVVPLQPNIIWGPAFSYDNGYNPSIGMVGSTVVEVHNGQAGYGPMWYHVGQVNGFTINWGHSIPYDSGWNPSVALTSCSTASNPNCLLAVEVHNYEQTPGAALLYHVGQVSGSTINLGGASTYDVGWNPKVAIVSSCGEGSTILEVHNGSGAPGEMWSQVGFWSSGSTIEWETAYGYASGWNPSIAAAGTSAIVEVHNQDSTFGPMWSLTTFFPCFQ